MGKAWVRQVMAILLALAVTATPAVGIARGDTVTGDKSG